MNDAARILQLERQLRDVDARLRVQAPVWPEVHEAWTAPGYGASTVVSNPANYQVLLAPLELHGRLRVRRASALIELTAPGAAIYKMALYRTGVLKIDRSDTDLSSRDGFQVSLVAELGTTSTTSEDVRRFNGTLARDVLIDPADGLYFVAYAVSDVTVGGWHSPANSWGRVRETSYVLNTATRYAFPMSLSVGAQATNITSAPTIVLRSLVGVHVLGDPGND